MAPIPDTLPALAHKSAAPRPAALRIVVADAHPATHPAYEEFLGGLGHQLVIARTGAQLVEQCRLLAPDLLIACASLPELDGVTAAEAVCRERPLPVVLLTDTGCPEAAGRALDNPNVLAVLEKPVKPGDLAAAVGLAVRRFALLAACREEAEALRQAMEERKAIERAKGAVMRRVGLDEAEAYRRLRKLSSNRNLKLAEVARTVLTAEETFELLERSESHGPAGADGGRPRSGSRNGPHAEGRCRAEAAV